MPLSRFAACPRRSGWIALALCALWPALTDAAPTASSRDAQIGAGSQLLLRKCVAAGGGVAYQSAPCAPGSRELWSRQEHRTPLPPTTVLPKVAAELAPRAWTGAAPTHTRSPSTRQRCDAAKAEAARKRDRGWNRLTFNDLSRLDAWVAERCK